MSKNRETTRDFFFSESFYKSAMRSLANCLALLRPTPEEKFDKFWKQMPQVKNDSGEIEINDRSEDAVLALGIYYLQSEFQFTDRILPYIVNIAVSYDKIVWKIDNIETFVYALHVLLGHIAVKLEDQKLAIVSKQVEMFHKLVVGDLADGKCKVLLGLILALCRNNSKECLFYAAVCSDVVCECYCATRHTCVKKEHEKIASRTSVFHSAESVTESQVPDVTEPPPETDFLFCGLRSEIRSLLDTAHVLLRKELPIDFSEKLRLSTVGLLKRLMCDRIKSSPDCLANMRSFADEIYAQIIFNLTYSSSSFSKTDIGVVASTCGDCLLLLEWTSMDEINAEQLLERLRAIIEGRFNEKTLFILCPILVSAFECVANVSKKHEGLKDRCLSLLRKFLLSPAATLPSFMSSKDLKQLVETAASAMGRILKDQQDEYSLQLVMKLSNRSLVGSRAIAENVIVALGTLAVDFAPSPLTVKIVHILQQSVYRQSIATHSLAIGQLAEIAVSRITLATYNQIVSFLAQLSSEPELWSGVLNALKRIAGKIGDFGRQQELLLRLLEVFVRLALRDDSPTRAVDLITVIDVLIQRIPRVSKPRARLRQLFFDFWLCVVVFRLPDNAALGNIAAKSPSLVSQENLQHNPACRDELLRSVVIAKYRNLPLRRSAFLMSVHRLESLRVTESQAEFSSFFMYYYVESPFISKANMLDDIFELMHNVFARVVSILRNHRRHIVVEQYVVFLLVKCNYPLAQVRQSAFLYLQLLYEEFPCVFWRRAVVWVMLDILQLLSGTLCFEEKNELLVPRTNFKLELVDNPESRKQAIEHFEQLCRRFLNAAIQSVPDTIQSHLQEYVASRPKPFETLKCHLGISLTIETILEPEKKLLVYSDFLDALTLRCRYSGELAAIFEQGPEAFASFRRKILASDDKNSLYQLTALIIALPEPERVLLYKLCHAPLSNSHADSITCWLWLLSARPDLELFFLCYMSSAWYETAIHRRGLFSENDESFIPHHQSSGCTNRVATIGLHKTWVAFLIERIRCASPVKLQICVDLLQRSLPVNVSAEGALCRHVNVSGTRFSLLGCAMSLIYLNPSMFEHVLRERVYATALDYFVGPPTCPHKSTDDLKSNIIAMMKFWHTMRFDMRELMQRRDDLLVKEDPKLHNEIYLYVQLNNLILRLLAVEIEFLITWYNPHSTRNLALEGEDAIFTWRNAALITSKECVQLVNLAWNICPALAVHLPARFKNLSSLISGSLPGLVLKDPMAVSNIPEALQYLATCDNIMADNQRLTYVLTWASTSSFSALAFFSREFPSHALTSQYAVRVLSSLPLESVSFCATQIVQALRHDPLGYVREFMIEISKKYQLVAHQLIWSLRSGGDSVIVKPIFDQVITDIENNFDYRASDFYGNEFQYFDDITSIAVVLRLQKKNMEERKEVCKRNLQAVSLRKGCYLPYSPEWVILELDVDSAKPLPSHAKAPFQVSFLVQHCPIDVTESTAPNQVPSGAMEWRTVIFKEGEDIRQDALALQIIGIFQKAFQLDELDLYLCPYHVVATDSTCGIVEFIPRTKSRDQLGRETGLDLYEYFLSVYGHENSPSFAQARENFSRSLAAYSVIMYLLQVKDRHNGNILLDAEGHIIHIDFGFLFENSPGGNLGFEPHLKITDEMLRILGVHPFLRFMSLCVKAYLAIRPYRGDIITLVSLMLDTRLPCFRGQTIGQLRERFQPLASEREAAQHILGILRSSCHNLRTWVYDAIQYYQNQISF